MIFNFFLGNHHGTSLNSMVDILEPIHLGLIENGHHVIGFGTAMREAPVVNVVVEFFRDDRFTDELLRMKAEAGDRFRFGVLSTEDPDDPLVMTEFPNRRPNFERVLAQADFAWTLLPVPGFFERACGADRVARVEYGFCEAYLDPRRVASAALRDVDVILYGNGNPYRLEVVRELQQRGLTCFVSQREVFPTWVVSDLIRRSKVLLDIRRGPEVRFLSPSRIVKGLHAATAVVSERFDTSPLARLYDYTVAVEYAGLAERCEQVVRSGIFHDLGRAALDKFRAETSMRDNMAAALRLPIFERLGAS